MATGEKIKYRATPAILKREVEDPWCPLNWRNMKTAAWVKWFTNYARALRSKGNSQDGAKKLQNPKGTKKNMCEVENRTGQKKPQHRLFQRHGGAHAMTNS